MIKFLNTKTQKMSAAIMTGAMIGTLGGSTQAMATQTLNTYLTTSATKVNQIPDLIAFLSYVGGVGLAALGIVSLKQHVEQGGQQKPMKDGLAKLGFGGVLLALPTITSVMQTTGTGTGPATNSVFATDPTM